MKKVTVLLSSYNQADYIGESIQSVLEQTFCDYAFKIVDDASTDDSWERIATYIAKYPEQIQGMRMQTNTFCQAFVEEIAKVKTPYLAIAHSDDKWMPDKLEKQVAYLDAHPEAAACFTLVQVIDEEGRPLEDTQTFYGQMFAQKNRTRQEWLRSFFEEGCTLCHPSLLIRTECYQEYALLSHGLSSIPDLYQWIQLCKHAQIHVLQEKLSCFRIRRNGKNTSGDNFRAHCRNATELYFVLPEYVRGCSRADFLKIFPEADRWLTTPRIPIEYAYARILLQEDRSRVHHLYGMQLLYDLMQDPAIEEILRADAGFDNLSFSQIKTREDIFSIVPAGQLMRCKVYLDFGDGFSEEESLLFDSLYVDGESHFSLAFSMQSETVQKMAGGRTLRQFRLDPDEGCYRMFWDIRFYADGELQTGTPCQRWHTDGDKVVFDSIDPQFLFSVPEKFEQAYFEGFTCKQNIWEVDARFDRLQRNYEKSLEQVKELQTKLHSAKNERQKSKIAAAIQKRNHIFSLKRRNRK